MSRDEYEPLEDEDLLFEVLLPLVDRPEELRVSKRSFEGGSVLVVTCSDGDRGRIIGFKGGNISAIRTLFRNLASKEDRKLNVEVEEPDRRGYRSNDRRKSRAGSGTRGRR